MGNLNKVTSFLGNAFIPVFGDTVYKSMRKKPIIAKDVLKFTDLTDFDLNKVKLIAHRGLSCQNPENSAPAFEDAGSRGGYFGLECDTHMTTDGEWVVVHDEELNSFYNASGDVKTFSSQELLELKTLRGANIEKHENLKMCTLQQYIDICKKHNCRPIIEIKDPRTQTMQSFYDMLVKNDIVDSTIVISFNIDDLSTLHKINPKLQMLYLVDYITSKSIRQAKESGCIGMDFSCAFNAHRPEWIKKVQQNGLIAAAWTIDDKESLKLMLDAGVTYITSNRIIPV